MARRSFTTLEKKAIVEDIEKKKGGNTSLRALCREHKIQIKQFQQWKQSFDEKLQPSQRWSAKSFHHGRTSSISHLETAILNWFEERSIVGLPTSVPMLVIHLSKMDNNFRCWTNKAQTHAVRRVLKRHRIVYCAVTHESQHLPLETRETATAYVAAMVPQMYRLFRDQRYIINMDETPIFSAWRTPRHLQWLEAVQSTLGSQRIPPSEWLLQFLSLLQGQCWNQW